MAFFLPLKLDPSPPSNATLASHWTVPRTSAWWATNKRKQARSRSFQNGGTYMRCPRASITFVGAVIFSPHLKDRSLAKTKKRLANFNACKTPSRCVLMQQASGVTVGRTAQNCSDEDWQKYQSPSLQEPFPLPCVFIWTLLPLWSYLMGHTSLLARPTYPKYSSS